MAAATLNLTIEQGSTFRYSLVVKDQNNLVSNLTGYVARMQIREDIDSPEPVIAMSTDNQMITITPLEGKVELYIRSVDTAKFDFSNAVYDLEIESPNGDVTRVVQGRIKLSREVTR